MSTDSALNLLNLFLPRKSTQTTTSSTNTSKEGVKAATDRILQSIIPAAASAQQNAGGFGSSAASLMYADAASRAGAYAEELNKTTTSTVTNKQAAPIDPRLALGGFLAYKLSETEMGKKATKGVSDWFSGLFGGGDTATSQDTPAFSLNFGGTGGNNLGDWGNGTSAGLLDAFVNLFGENKADGGTIQGDPNEAFQAVLAAIQGNNKGSAKGFYKDNVPGSGNMGSFFNAFGGYGPNVSRDFSREFGNFLRMGQGVVTANPTALASGVADMARYNANQQMLQGFANNDPEAIQSSLNTISTLQALGDTVGTVGKAKNVVDGFSNISDLASTYNAVESTAGKTLVGALTGDQALTTAKSAISLYNTATGGSSSSSNSSDSSGDTGSDSSGGGFWSQPNYSFGRLGGASDPTGGGGSADGGFIGGKFQRDLKGKDRIPVNLSGGEHIIPADVVAKLGPDFFDNLIASLHKTTRG